MIFIAPSSLHRVPELVELLKEQGYHYGDGRSPIDDLLSSILKDYVFLHRNKRNFEDYSTTIPLRINEYSEVLELSFVYTDDCISIDDYLNTEINVIEELNKQIIYDNEQIEYHQKQIDKYSNNIVKLKEKISNYEK